MADIREGGLICGEYGGGRTHMWRIWKSEDSHVENMEEGGLTCGEYGRGRRV